MGLPAPTRTPSRTLVAAAFAAIYLIWGSTYLAIRFAIDTLPPFTMAGSRFVIGGGVLYAVARVLGAERPTGRQWLSTFIVGGLLLLGGNGGVTYAELTVPSGVAALLVATVPLWMLLLQWLLRDGATPSMMEVAGVLLGFAGVVLLFSPWRGADDGRADRFGMLLLVGASLSWSFGSLISRRMTLPSSPWLTTAMQMLCGGFLLGLMGLCLGEWWRVDFAGVTAKSWLSFAYLTIVGSLVGFSAYVWLLRVSTPARVATYAYVNPVVAVALGWSFGGESLTALTVVGMCVIVAGVVMTTTAKQRKAKSL